MSAFPQLSTAQVKNLLQGRSSGLMTDPVTIIEITPAPAVYYEFTAQTDITIRHNGQRYVQATVYNTDFYEMPPARIRSKLYGYDETDPDDPFYYVRIVFAQSESGVVRITL